MKINLPPFQLESAKIFSVDAPLSWEHGYIWLAATMENNVNSNNSTTTNNSNNDNNNSTSKYALTNCHWQVLELNEWNPSKLNMYSTHNIKETGNIPSSHQQSLSKNLTSGCIQFLGYLSKLYKPENNVIIHVLLLEFEWAGYYCTCFTKRNFNYQLTLKKSGEHCTSFCRISFSFSSVILLSTEKRFSNGKKRKIEVPLK